MPSVSGTWMNSPWFSSARRAEEVEVDARVAHGDHVELDLGEAVHVPHPGQDRLRVGDLAAGRGAVGQEVDRVGDRVEVGGERRLLVEADRRAQGAEDVRLVLEPARSTEIAASACSFVPPAGTSVVLPGADLRREEDDVEAGARVELRDAPTSRPSLATMMRGPAGDGAELLLRVLAGTSMIVSIDLRQVEHEEEARAEDALAVVGRVSSGPERSWASRSGRPGVRGAGSSGGALGLLLLPPVAPGAGFSPKVSCVTAAQRREDLLAQAPALGVEALDQGLDGVLVAHGRRARGRP